MSSGPHHPDQETDFGVLDLATLVTGLDWSLQLISIRFWMQHRDASLGMV